MTGLRPGACGPCYSGLSGSASAAGKFDRPRKRSGRSSFGLSKREVRDVDSCSGQGTGRGHRRRQIPVCSGTLELAARVLVRSASAASREALAAGKLQGLGAVSRGGAVWVSGRIRKEKLAELLGTMELPILMPSEPLALSVLRKAHRHDHRRSPQDLASTSCLDCGCCPSSKAGGK